MKTIRFDFIAMCHKTTTDKVYCVMECFSPFRMYRGRLEELDVGGGDFDGGGKEAGELD